MTEIKSIAEALRLAAEQGGLAEKLFYECLWESEVYVPLELSGTEQTIQSAAGEKFMGVIVEGRRTVPVFSTLTTLEQWAGHDGFAVTKHSFKTLVQLVAADTWLHLDPGQEIGKEFSSWEIEQLRRAGLAAVNEIVSEQGKLSYEVEIEDHQELYQGIKKKLQVVFESYREIKEGFAIKMKDTDHPQGIPVIAVKQEGMSAERLKMLQEEIAGICYYDAETGVEPVVISNLGTAACPHQQLFENASPFYYWAEQYENSAIKSWLSK